METCARQKPSRVGITAARMVEGWRTVVTGEWRVGLMEGNLGEASA